MAKDDTDSDREWEKEVEAFEKTKAGVKGLVDSGVSKVPRFFLVPEGTEKKNKKTGLQVTKIPIIDFDHGRPCGERRRLEIVEEIREACRDWGFFQMVNHGVPTNAMEAVLDATRKFHEQPKEMKTSLYSSNGRQSVRFYTINGNLKKPAVAGWRDAFSCTFTDDYLDPDSIPSICRNEICEYMKHMIELRDVLSELLSEALGLSSDFLSRMECMKSEYLSCLYYPASPQPDRTCGTVNHFDPTILTVLVQDNCSGLQIHHDENWIDVPSIPGALIANIGDLLQLITNDKFKSVEHRVVASSSRSRVSTACFFYPSSQEMVKACGPIKELLSEENPALYRHVSYIEFVTHHQTNVREGQSALSNFRIM
ncbi:1-aminocyclopropane-1-carboxylate oxidase homolog 11 [Striga hermonthica]|uniref:1-aminocyclopropane-1-carboxylate oxidase homolog 11 n=1 Tax=Striga hermonthica TaxID=68872 RepID=A0A9N7REA2_STRHE|nr:1-aminocyclopropane-1-carboxylate oxidase homolog 11 [Striga hermonthica]